MDRIAEANKALEQAKKDLELARHELLVRARVIVDEQRLPAFPHDGDLHVAVMRAHLEHLGGAVDRERAAEEAALKARAAVVAAHDAAAGRAA